MEQGFVRGPGRRFAIDRRLERAERLTGFGLGQRAAAAHAEASGHGEGLLAALRAPGGHPSSVASLRSIGVTNDRAAAVLDELRAAGVRITRSRRAVVDALVTADDHVTADDLAAQVATAEPDVHRSTVYRTLDALEQAGVVTHVHLGHGRAVYHLTDRLHHHAVCEVCGAVIELAADVLGDVGDRLRRDAGFEIDPHHFALVGRCRGCR